MVDTAIPPAPEVSEAKETTDEKDYYGYMFKSDKTGTDKLKRLLRALHKIIGTTYEPSDSPDLTPAQLAHFYRANNGNYDPLFLSTPPSAIAFIYKNLGCLHSLQPISTAASAKRFYEPTIPALKVEGWIMWETIQLLLGPDEHAGFLMSAVQKWDIKDPDTGELLPKTLPRECFPAAPDAHMISWYEGVSERLRREAEEEQSTRVHAIEEEPRKQIEYGERHHRKHDKERAHTHETDDEEEKAISKRSALAYFRDPLFRKEDGESSVVRRKSKHPSLVKRGKIAATSVGHVVMSVASPHLWDGSSSGTKDKERDRNRSQDRDRDRDRHRRRRTPPTDRTHDDEDYDELDENGDVLSPKVRSRHAALQPRRGSKANSPIVGGEHFDSQRGTPRGTPPERFHHRQHSSPTDHTVRHSKSHDPTPSPREYFPPYDAYNQRRGSHQEDALSPGAGSTAAASPAPRSPHVSRSGSRGRPLSTASEQAETPGEEAPTSPPVKSPLTPLHTNTFPGFSGGFMPTASPLFATHIARSENRAMAAALSVNKKDQGGPPQGRHSSLPRSPQNGYGGSGSAGRSDSSRRGEDRRGSEARPAQRPRVARFDDHQQQQASRSGYGNGRQSVREAR